VPFFPFRTGKLSLQMKNRQIIWPWNSTPLSVCIPIEDMDEIIHPIREELIVNPEHLFMAQIIMK
jgi:hypothetical protein